MFDELNDEESNWLNAWQSHFEPAESDPVAESDDAIPDFLDGPQTTGREIVYKRGLPLNLQPMIKSFLSFPSRGPGVQQAALEYVVLFVYGHRNVKKYPVDERTLTRAQKRMYQYIKQKLQNPVRRQRIFNFINQRNITKRLIGYFVVHYALLEQKLGYYLDMRTYPYKILGEYNKPHQPKILRLMEKHSNIVWINLYQEYKSSKNNTGGGNCHAPYRRKVTVRGKDNMNYSLCELSFYIWLDSIGGFEVFYDFEKDVRLKKAKYDQAKRALEIQPATNQPKKRKIMLRKTDGRNFKARLLKYKPPPDFVIQVPSVTKIKP